MYGTGVGHLTVYTSYRGENYPVFQVYNNQGDQWLETSIDTTISYAEKVMLQYNFYNILTF